MSSPTLSSMTATFKVVVSGSAALNQLGADYSPLSDALKINKSIGPFNSSISNTTAMGANELYSMYTIVASGASTTVNVTSLTDFLNQGGLNFARIKAYLIRLISKTDDSVNGTPCSGITLNGSGGTNLLPLPGITDVTINNGDFLCWATNNPTGVVTSSTAENIYITNNDSANSAVVQITLVGGTN